ncbi:phosphate/phosphite/phosphonate ABC transporter substrate-binding protein [Luteimonas sp. MC1895]|uniref:phosphate/phosphite/phosphonate ABC transporter substrate-binding protein n=1 Tax=Luteimonas sp. MC1895 TaxID=2819513 RepID=UPI0018F0F2F0|nr:phosphate/phosphite/phosphonate ABC transporter substrate-binding protein [Luteimonas sp. MC1895]MBJ6978023.1 phosphate/phosphite/phosphonate ABC transporter substrate-binding protein [Luteimonas sp. MC1895]
MPRRLRQLLLAMAASLAFCVPALGAPVAAAEPGVLVLGRISDDPAAHYDQLRQLLDYVVPRMADVGIREGRVLMARDSKQMESYLRRGRVDWVTETSGSAMALQTRAGATPLLLTERDGVGAYHTVFIARRDSGIAGLADLRGRSIAFQNPSSTSAYFVPAMTLIGRGLELEILLSPTDRPAEGSIGYLFARSELNISTWVHKGLVDAGAFSNLDWESVQRMPESYRRDLVVFHSTAAFPRGLEMVRGDLEPAIAARLREVLAGAANDPAASEALQRFFGTTRFLPIDAETARALDLLRAGVANVGKVIE